MYGETVGTAGTFTEGTIIDSVVFSAFRPYVLRDAGLQHTISVVFGDEHGRSLLRCHDLHKESGPSA